MARPRAESTLETRDPHSAGTEGSDVLGNKIADCVPVLWHLNRPHLWSCGANSPILEQHGHDCGHRQPAIRELRVQFPLTQLRNRLDLVEGTDPTQAVVPRLTLAHGH